MNISKLVAALTLAFGASFSAHAVTFDPDGAGSASAIDVGGFGWNTTSAVAQGGNTAITNFLTGTGPTTFNVLTHAVLVNTNDSNGNLNTPSGLNTNYQITMVVRFQETVSSVTPGPNNTGTAMFTSTGQGLLQIYYDPIINATDLTGSGFNDGRLILQGNVVQSGRTGTFLVTDSTAVRFDQFATNTEANDNYGTGSAFGTAADQGAVTGFGSQLATSFGGLTQDNTFFLNTLASFGITFANISQQIPFGQAQPSDCFSQLASAGVVGGSVATGSGTCANVHTDAPYAGQAIDPNGGYLPVVGLVDGLFTSGPDFVFQTRYDASFATAVPEPGSVALFAIGLVGLSAAGLKRRRAGKSA